MIALLASVAAFLALIVIWVICLVLIVGAAICALLGDAKLAVCAIIIATPFAAIGAALERFLS